MYWGRRLRTIDDEAFRGTYLFDVILRGVYNTDADINSDGKVDIDDVARIISIILNKQ